MSERENDVKLLKLAAQFFDGLDLSAPTAQAIRRAAESLEMEIQMEAEFASEDIDLNSDIVNASWERFKAMLPVAKVTNNNQPGTAAIIEILSNPPTLDVGMMLYAHPKA